MKVKQQYRTGLYNEMEKEKSYSEDGSFLKQNSGWVSGEQAFSETMLKPFLDGPT